MSEGAHKLKALNNLLILEYISCIMYFYLYIKGIFIHVNNLLLNSGRVRGKLCIISF